MSIYQHLSTPIPTIAYCALHQANNNILAEEYTKTMKELHERIAEETALINSGYALFLKEAAARESQMMHTALSQYLQTPLRGDNNDVRRILEESYAKFQKAHVSTGLGLKRSVEGRVFLSPSKKTLEKKLLQNGKAYLEELGFAFGKGKGHVFESMFVIEGGINLDMLEYIVRDKLGIYATTHGKHIKEFSGYSYAAYNLVYSSSELPAKEAVGKYTELAFFFSKPDMKYAPFRKGLTDALVKLSSEIPIDHLSLWQRKLGLGTGVEFVLRLMCNNADAISESIQWLSAYKDKPVVRDVLTGDGKLVVKELLF
jgi:hypothetical protein